MKEEKKVQITEQICKQIQLMRKGGANQTEIGLLLGINPSTVSRIEKAGFDVEQYLENKRLAREKEKAAKAVTVELVYDPGIAEEYRREQEQKAEEQVPGQMEMDLTPKSEMSETTKMMRFQAHQVDKICEKITNQSIIINETLLVKLDRLNDTLCQILRAVRKE